MIAPMTAPTITAGLVWGRASVERKTEFFKAGGKEWTPTENKQNNTLLTFRHNSEFGQWRFATYIRRVFHVAGVRSIVRELHASDADRRILFV